jgi:rare lipoprotein A (peptidoglycan hydrolase)
VSRRFPYSAAELRGAFLIGLALGVTVMVLVYGMAPRPLAQPSPTAQRATEGPGPSSPTATDLVRPSSTPPGVSPQATPRSGTASWYGAAGRVAAVPGWDHRPYRVRVCAGARCVVVRVQDWCGCYVGTSRERIIDLSRSAFLELAPLSRGVIRVTLEVLDG